MFNGTINNDGTWTANSTSTLEAYGGYPGGTVNAFNNNATGTFTQAGDGHDAVHTSYAGVAFNNAGTVNVSQGTLQLYSGGTNSAAINVSARCGCGLLRSTTRTQQASSLNGPGSINFAATQTVAGAVTISGILNFSSGTLPRRGFDRNRDGELDGRDPSRNGHDGHRGGEPR